MKRIVILVVLILCGCAQKVSTPDTVSEWSDERLAWYVQPDSVKRALLTPSAAGTKQDPSWTELEDYMRELEHRKVKK